MITDNKIIDIANYIIDTKSTIRETAKQFRCSKTNIHRLIHNNLSQLDYELYSRVKKVLAYNLSQRATRGGRSTRLRWAEYNIHRSWRAKL